MSVHNHAFSIIIPLYNKESSIEKTVCSVLKQTLKDFELIIVNDGSTDASLSRAEKIAAVDPRIVIYNKPNGGASSARNLGIEKARFPFIAFLDADDVWAAQYLAEMSSLIARYPGCGMYGCAYKIVRLFHTTCACQNIPEGIVADYFQMMLQTYISRTSATIIKRQVFEEVGLFPNGMIEGEDCFMWAKVATKYTFAFTPKVLCTYNVFFSGALHRIGKPDTCQETWYDLYSRNDFYRNEYIAKRALERGIRHALGNYRSKSREIENRFQYTQLFKHKWKKLYLFNRLPYPLIRFIFLYKKLRYFYYKF